MSEDDIELPFDPEAEAKEVTAPLIESMREEFGKVDVKRFSK